MSTSELAQNGNGTAPLTPAVPVDPISPIIEQLEEQLAPIAARRAQLESEIAELLKQEGRIKAGITALKSGAPKPKAAAPTRGKHDWSPSPKTCDDVYAALARSSEPMTVTQLADKTEISRGTVTKALDVLRADERVRLTGNAPTPGAPKAYTVMT